MITWLTGENSFEVREAIRELEASFGAPAERVDGTELRLQDIPELLMGMSLFASKRLVVITDITQNSAVWEKLPDWLPRVSDDIHVVFVDAKPDKRTTGYKALAQAAEVRDAPVWGERDESKATQWLVARAKQHGSTLGGAEAAHIVKRVGVNQWALAQALETVALLDEITPTAIDEVIPNSPAENIFQLFETALEGSGQQVATMLRTLSLTEDPYALNALINSQVLSLAAVTYASADATPSKDFGIHPYVASKLQRHAKTLGKAKVGQIVELFAQTDADMKRSKADPWVLLERVLQRVVRLAS